MKLTFLGTGTSHGVPVIKCNCKVCRSKNKKDKRYRSSVFIQTNKNKNILIDIGPEFRIQALENKITKIDTLLLTHSHADHFHGIDDLRIFSCNMYKKPEDPKSLEQYNAPPIPIFANSSTVQDIGTRFSYFFNQCKEGGGFAKVELKEITNTESFIHDDITITPIPMLHGRLETCGWLLSEKQKDGTTHSIAYLTDCSFIANDSLNLINKNCGILDHLIIDALRVKEHSTHFNFDKAMEAANQTNAKHVWFTHLTHSHSHKEVIKYIKKQIHNYPNLEKCKSVLPAYDKLVIYTK